MTAYPVATLFAADRTAPPVPEHRFTVVTAPYPEVNGTAGPCSECADSGPVNVAIGEVRYHSSAVRSPVAEATCLPCLPGLLRFLDQHGEGPLTVVLYSPVPDARTPRVARWDHERAELIGLLLASRGPSTTAVLHRNFAAVGAQLRRLAETTRALTVR